MNLRILAALAIPLATPTFAQKPKPATPAIAKPAIAEPTARPTRPNRLIHSEVLSLETQFIREAIGLGRTLMFLAEKSAKVTNTDLQGYSRDLVTALAAQSAVLDTLAEMRNIALTQEPPELLRQRAKLDKLQGPKLEKALLESYIETDEQLVALYERNRSVEDPTIAKFVEQSLPQAREHLKIVRNMAGITQPDVSPPPPTPLAEPPQAPAIAEPQKPKRPGFRTHAPLAPAE